MILRTVYRIKSDGTRLYRTWSDQDVYIQREDGVKFVEAIDIETSGHTYLETEDGIPSVIEEVESDVA